MTTLAPRPAPPSVPAADTSPQIVRDHSGWIAVALSALAALLIISPCFWWGNASGHDFEFHAASWLDAAAQWHNGIWYPRWQEWANHGFGEPRFIFYPPLSWMLGAALGSFLPWNSVPAVFIVLVQTLAGAGAFALVRRFASSRAAVFAAACYAANPYALLVIYMRSDFAEQLASAILPVAALFALKLARADAVSPRDRLRDAALFAIAFAALWLSNAPAGVLASYSFALLFAWLAWEQRSSSPLFWGGFAAALGLGLSAFYIAPAAYEQRWVNIGQVLSSGLLPSENFLYTTLADPEHNLFNWIASTVSILLILIALLAAFFVFRRRAGLSSSRNLPPGLRLFERTTENAMLLLTAVSIFMMLRLSASLWPILPKLRFVQFPWRWALVLAIPCGFFLGVAFEKSRRRMAWVLALLAISGGSAGYLITHTWWDTDDMPSLADALTEQQGFDGTDEYDPAGDDHYDLPAEAPQAAALAQDSEDPARAAITVFQWSAEQKELRVVSNEPARIALRLLNYPAWRVTVNGTPVSPQKQGQTMQMVVPVPRGTSEISVRFRRTPDRILGSAVAAASLAIAGFCLAGGFRIRRT